MRGAPKDCRGRADSRHRRATPYWARERAEAEDTLVFRSYERLVWLTCAGPRIAGIGEPVARSMSVTAARSRMDTRQPWSTAGRRYGQTLTRKPACDYRPITGAQGRHPSPTSATNTKTSVSPAGFATMVVKAWNEGTTSSTSRGRQAGCADADGAPRRGDQSARQNIDLTPRRARHLPRRPPFGDVR